MKSNTYKSLLVIIVILIGVFNSGCRKEAGMKCQTSPAIVNSTDDISNLQVPNFSILQAPVLQESTPEIELAIKADGIPSEEDLQIYPDVNSNEFASGAAVNIEFIRFLKSLNLTPEQKAKLKGAILGYTQCRKELFMQLRKLNQEIIAKGNKERAELILQFKKKAISDIEFKKAMMALNMRIKKAILENPERTRILAAIEKCHQRFLANIKLILNPRQMELWVKWYRLHQ